MHSDSVRTENRRADIGRKPRRGGGVGRLGLFSSGPEKMAENAQKTPPNDFEIDTFQTDYSLTLNELPGAALFLSGHTLFIDRAKCRANRAARLTG